VPKFALAGPTGDGSSGNKFRPDIDMVEAPGSHHGQLLLPSGNYLVEYEGSWNPGSQHQELGEYALTDPVPPGGRGALANELGVPASAFPVGATLGECLLVWMSGSLVPAQRGNGRRWEIKIGKSKVYDAPVIEGGAVDSDNFNRSNEALSTSANWNNVSTSDAEVLSNECSWDASSSETVTVIWQNSLSADMTVDTTVTGASSGNGFVGVVARGDNTANNYFWNACNNNHSLDKIVGGSESNVGINFVVGKFGGVPNALQLDCSGTSIDSDWDGDTLSSTETDLQTNTYAGVIHDSNFSVAFTQDDWSATYTGLVIEQEGFRFRTDSGNEATATWEAAQDTNVTMPAEITKGLRVVINYTDDPPTGKPKLQYRAVGASTWKDVGN
jgi:hypothetical protein